mmetsp:Transcript_139/g.496  ORF Transcript_139/g.496 Transcript_139/m.496 type:complete len:265 (+) Transcript_139:13-807(+)
MDEEELQRVYQWIDEIPLSRPKRNIARDFADGVLVAEVVAHYYPRMVELHNYPAANSFAQKMYNWQTLSKKVFKKIGLAVAKGELEALSNAEPGAIEQLLKRLQVQLAKYNLRKQQQHAQQQQQGRMDGGGAEGDYYEDNQDDPRAGAPHPQSYDAPAPSQHQTQPAQVGGAPPLQQAQVLDPQGAGGRGALPSQRTAAALAAGADPTALLQERDQSVDELSETVEILEVKVGKLEQLVRLKEAKIQTLTARLQHYEGGGAPQR